jgi:hypothetical protein
MKKLLRSTFGTFVVAAFFIIAPPTYARRGHGGGHGGGHAFRGGAVHAKAAHFAGRARPGGGRAFRAGILVGSAVIMVGEAAITATVGQVTAITAWATAIPITGITDTTLGDIILTATDTGRP